MATFTLISIPGRSMMASTGRSMLLCRNNFSTSIIKAPQNLSSTRNSLTISSRPWSSLSTDSTAAASKFTSTRGLSNKNPITLSSRHWSSSAAAESTATKANAAGTTNGEMVSMDWNSYFLLRRTRRNYERVFMVPCSLLSLLAAGYYFAQKDFDPTPIFGMDQVVVYFAGTVAAGIIGLAMGPVVGNMAFRLTHSKAKTLVDTMDKEFFKHIVKNRADPTSNSVRNPVPDYYGEKIKSVSEYRQWLRKQREFRRKATFFVGVD